MLPPLPIASIRRSWRHLSLSGEALTSLAGSPPRTPSSCSHCEPGGLWVTRRMSEPTAPRSRGSPRARCPSRACILCCSLPDLPFKECEGICPKQSSRKRRRKRESKFSVTLFSSPSYNRRSWGCDSKLVLQEYADLVIFPETVDND